ncbi:MAG TPA: FecR domain-containing protein [Nitrosomonas europaea]|uniref:FecR domain-containing protein n=1 Tax=Nitrosomonas europaea TaxID=915 RepID=UPI0024926C50|nr:FecR domain-containing protein [Nitrosomonas europaea]HRN80961.1 FecR domain-containing protein [Nitrosomonas europaea]HRO55554.1 FecR domain-containing protein [Nitrosomonas europaea]HRQ07427.1 FecR domain-containing protein [Nitrosomonas europaea]HUM73164.1 FecR domain-containing protein [Nitrosomonas europaea]
MTDGVSPQEDIAQATEASHHSSDRLPESVIDAAISWAVRLDYNTPTTAQQQAFEYWLQANPLHRLAWQRIHSLKGFHADLGELSPKLAHDTLQTAQRHREHSGLSRRNVIKLLSLAGVALSTGWLARENTPWQRLLADASTATGEQKTLQLDDGSIIVLNTDSAVSTDLAGPHRLLMLWRGEILITTGADTGIAMKRPFWVHTPFGRIQALGTRFVVRLEADRARISVQEGAVELHPVNGGFPVIVQSGESRWLAEEGTLPADLQGFEADSWQKGVIAGRNIRLQDLLSELSRYRPGYITCDPGVADLRLSGLFHVKETDRTLQFLTQIQPISITYRTRFWVSVGLRDFH